MNDLKYAIRALIRSPLFTVIAVVTLALGIGLNTAMFSLINTLFLRPLPFADPASLVRVFRSTPGNSEGDLPASDFLELRASGAAFGEFASSWDGPVSFSEVGGTTGLQNALHVSTNYLAVLKVRPELGRDLAASDETSGAKVVVISHALWESHFNGDAAVLGREVRINGDTRSIVGVLPEFSNDGRLIRDIAVFIPQELTAAERASRGDPWMRVIGRRSAGVTPAAANSLVAAIGSRLEKANPREDGAATWRTQGLLGSTESSTAKVITSLLIGLSTCVMLIACSNLANFALARTLERSQELSVRSALGASLAQLVRPLGMESLILACGGGLMGLFITSLSTQWLNRQSTVNGGSSIQFPMDWRVLGVAVASSIATALVFGAGPSLLIARINVNETLKNGGRGATTGKRHRTLRSLLVAGQFAMAMTLVAGAAFLIRGADGVLRQHLGWDSGNVVAASFNLPKARYDSAEKILSFHRRLAEAVRAVPGVDSVALAYALPYSGSAGGHPYTFEGKGAPAKGQEPSASYDGITADFFRVTGGRIVAGRPFSEADTAAAPRVAIISEGMARAFFPNENPIGKRLSRADLDKPDWCEVVGVAADSRPASLYQQPFRYQVYLPLAQEPWQFAMFAVRSRPGAQKSVMAAVGASFASVSPDIPVENLMPAEKLVERTSFELGMLIKMLGTFALFGLLMAALGIYGVIARTVVQRTPEIGIRMALGASMGNVKALILGSGIRLALIGSLFGLAGGITVSKLLGTMIPAINGSPLPVILASAGVLGAVALVACYLPAQAASRINPVIAIRGD